MKEIHMNFPNNDTGESKILSKRRMESPAPKLYEISQATVKRQKVQEEPSKPELSFKIGQSK